MFQDERHEEEHPLLPLYVLDNDKRSEFPHRVAFVDKDRGQEVKRGAATIITQWSAQLTACWLTSVILGTCFIFMALMLLMSILQPIHHLHSRCLPDHANSHAIKTILLVKNGKRWTQGQLDILKLIAETYPDYEVHSLVLESSMRKFRTKRKTKTADIPKATTHTPALDDKVYDHNYWLISLLNKFDKFFDKYTPRPHKRYSEENDSNSIHTAKKKRKERVTNGSFQSYGDILREHKNIKNKNSTFKLYFAGTPLQYYWSEFSTHMQIFAIRVHELWQNGGITFFLPANNDHDNNDINKNEITHSVQNTSENLNTFTPIDATPDILHLKSLILNTKSDYENLGQNFVSVNAQGLYMATRTPCHAFFGDILVRMKNEGRKLSVSAVIQEALNLFCRKGVVESDYCKVN